MLDIILTIVVGGMCVYSAFQLGRALINSNIE